MVGAWYTLRALAREWDPLFASATVVDCFSASRDELTLLLDSDTGRHGLRISVVPSDRYVFRQADATRPRKNVLTLFQSVVGRKLAGVRAADRDRVLDLGLDDGSGLRILLFGSRANVLHVSADGIVTAAFREKVARIGQSAPEPVAAPDPGNGKEVGDRWPGESMDMARALGRVFPLFDGLLCAELAHRAGLADLDACLAGEAEWASVAVAAAGLRRELAEPTPVIYRDGRNPVAFSLVPLADAPAPEAEEFSSVDEAVRVFVRASLSQRTFGEERDPLLRTLESAAVRNRARRDRMLTALVEPTRADRYERFGHLLMAAGHGRAGGVGLEEMVVPDLFEGGADVSIPLDPARSVIDNANRYYEKARVTRRAREDAESRLDDVEKALVEAERLLTELQRVEDRAGLKAFSARNTHALERFRRDRPSESEARPFRRFDLGHGYEVWVGRNAKENDELTFGHARKHDYWMHARGSAGSHVVLRRIRANERPPSDILDRAAAIAAWFSKARGSALVPVIVCERKYVRKPRKAAPGAVVVEREEVRLVPPGLPGGEDS